MTPFLLIITGLIYIYVSVESLLNSNIGLSIMYLGYAIGNAGAWYLAVNSGVK